MAPDVCPLSASERAWPLALALPLERPFSAWALPLPLLVLLLLLVVVEERDIGVLLLLGIQAHEMFDSPRG